MPTIEELKAKLQGLNRGGGKGKDIWKPTDKHDIRIVKYPHGPETLIELYFHYDVGDAPILCPKANNGDDCEVCDFADRLKAWKDPNGRDKPEADKKSDWEIFKKIQAKASVFIPVVERGKESAGAKFWRVSPPQATELLEEAMNKDRMEECGLAPDESDAGKIFDVLCSPSRAYDIEVELKKPGEKGNNRKFAITSAKAKIKPSPLSKNPEEVKNILASVKRITEVYPPVSSAEVAKIFAKWAGNSSPEAKPEGGTEKYAPKAGDEKARTTGRSIDDAFADLSGDEAA